MTDTISLIEQPQRETLSLRTWRQWWGQTSSLFRSAVWGGGAFAIIHGLLAVRIAIGLCEDPVITQFRSHGEVSYRWEIVDERFQGHHLLLAGMMGRSCRNVTYVSLAGNVTDDDLERIGSRFIYLKQLELAGTEISSAGMRYILPCRRLEHLNLTDTDIDDDGVKTLAALPQLQSLDLAGTLITDASLPVLNSMPALRHFDPEWTEFSPAARQAMLQSPSRTRIVVNLGQDEFPRLVRASIRWSDGEVCERFPDDPSYCEKNLPKEVGSVTEDIDGGISWYSTTIGCYFGPHSFGRSQLNQRVTEIASKTVARGDGEYTLSISFGDCASETITYRVTDGKLSTDRFVFRLPVTREEALRSVSQVNSP